MTRKILHWFCCLVVYCAYLVNGSADIGPGNSRSDIGPDGPRMQYPRNQKGPGSAFLEIFLLVFIIFFGYVNKFLA